MLYRPKGERGTKPELAPRRTPAAREWISAVAAAVRFWDRVAIDNRISEEFRGTCSGNIATVQALQSGPQIIGS